VKNEGIFVFDSLDQVRKLLREGFTGEMQGTTYVRVIAPLFIPFRETKLSKMLVATREEQISSKGFKIGCIPDIDDRHARIACEREKLRRCDPREASRHCGTCPSFAFSSRREQILCFFEQKGTNIWSARNHGYGLRNHGRTRSSIKLYI
jgi:hypothetical protein